MPSITIGDDKAEAREGLEFSHAQGQKLIYFENIAR